MAGVVGLEPTKWRSQSPLPYHLATPQSIMRACLLYKSQKKVKIILRFFEFCIF